VNDLALVLRIENMDSLPDGGPLSITLDRRGCDIGRDTYLDWTLPDPARFISGKHCEVRYRDGGYWLHDVSTNGTIMNEDSGRLTEPRRLKNGDRIHIGDYIVVAELEGDAAAPAPPASTPSRPAGSDDPWGGFDDVAASVSRRDFTTGTTSGGGSMSGRPVMGDISEEEFSWSVGEVESPPAAKIEADWASPAQPSAPTASPSPPSRPSAPPAPEPAPQPDWGAAATEPEEEPLELTTRELPDAAQDEEPLELTPAPAPQEPAPRQGRLAEQWQQDSPPAPSSAAPPPEPAAAPATPAAPAPASGGSWVAAFERGAGLPAGSVARAKGDDALAEEMGQLFRIVAENLKAMLAARDETKNAMRSSQRTMIQAMENNPLKFSPTPEDAMRIMFGEKVRSYLDARETLESSFNDLKSHQMMTFNAMQQALQALIEDLDPDRISEGTASEGGLAGLVSSRRAKLWDMYCERYKSKAGRHERGMIDAFMILFAEMYDRQGRG